MKKVTLCALDNFDYDGQQRRRGQEFEAAEGDAKLLVLAGRATYVMRTIEPEQPRTLHLPKGKYARRDMEAK